MKLKKIFNWRLILGICLVLFSISTYSIEYLFFHDRKFIIMAFLNDLAFVAISVLFVTLILDQLMQGREKQSRMNKSNMVIGAFFSEVGNDLLRTLAANDPDSQKMARELTAHSDWGEKGSKAKLHRILHENKYHITMSKKAFDDLKGILTGRREFMVRLLENQTLLEHEKFTDVLWASFHLSDELSMRNDHESLPESDLQHLALDAHRAYVALAGQWVDYLLHLRTAYPYLFSLALRLNPFDKDASPIIRS